MAAASLAAVPVLAGGDPARPYVGAIRWDAWHGDQGVPGRAVQHSLGPLEWHGRLPFFAQAEGADRVRIDGTAQSVMDREIAYASGSGLDYWAFVTYAKDDPMSLGLAHYLASERRQDLRFCLITECGRWAAPEFANRVLSLMAEPGYLTVLGGRPVLYLGFIQDDKVASHWQTQEGFRRMLDAFRARVRARGQADPYVVIMDFKPPQGKRWLDCLGADALSCYAAQGGGKQAPYADLAAYAEGFWDRCRECGGQVVPILMAGWDRRPRVDRPVPWEPHQKPGAGRDKFYQPPTPAELADHVRNGLAWLKANPDSARARLALIYAWNENDEGGWLVPTLGEGPARLEALAGVLKAPAERPGDSSLPAGAPASQANGRP